MPGHFLTFSQIRQFNESHFNRRIVASAEKRQKAGSTFLSYSTLDDELLPTIIGILEGHGARVYIDKKDPSLPSTTSPETAEKLRNNIKLSSKFVLFVTPNSKESKWIPWELGLADGEKSNYKVALFPAAEKSYEQTWSEQEYLGLYQRILWWRINNQKDGWIVLNHRDNVAVYLDKWLRGY